MSRQHFILCAKFFEILNNLNTLRGSVLWFFLRIDQFASIEGETSLILPERIPLKATFPLERNRLRM